MTYALSIAFVCSGVGFAIGFYMGYLRGRIDATDKAIRLLNTRAKRAELLPDAEAAIVRAENRLLASITERI